MPSGVGTARSLALPNMAKSSAKTKAISPWQETISAMRSGAAAGNRCQCFFRPPRWAEKALTPRTRAPHPIGAGVRLRSAGAKNGRRGPRGRERRTGGSQALSSESHEGSVVQADSELPERSSGVHEGSTPGSISRGPLKALGISGVRAKIAQGVHEGIKGVRRCQKVSQPLWQLVDPSGPPTSGAPGARGGEGAAGALPTASASRARPMADRWPEATAPRWGASPRPGAASGCRPPAERCHGTHLGSLALGAGGPLPTVARWHSGG
jgi:hypothetical protein